MDSFLKNIDSVANTVFGNIGGGLGAVSPYSVRVERAEMREGGVAELLLSRGRVVRATILGIDTLSWPHRARVQREDNNRVLTAVVVFVEDVGTASCETVLDTRTTTIFQDFEDSFDLVSDYWKKPSSASKSTTRSEHSKDDVSVGDGHRELTDAVYPQPKLVFNVEEQVKFDNSKVKALDDSVSNLSWETASISGTIPPMESLVTRMASLDNLKDLLVAPLAELGKAQIGVPNSWDKFRFSESLSFRGTNLADIAPLGNLMKKFSVDETLGATVGDCAETQSRSADATANVVVEPEFAGDDEGEVASNRPSFEQGFMAKLGEVSFFNYSGVLGGTSATFERAALPPLEDVTCKLIRKTFATLPLDMCFDLPSDFVRGQLFIFIQGPHGAMRVPVPPNAEPGQRVSFRLGSSKSLSVRVPDSTYGGQFLRITSVDGRCIQIQVPVGKGPGDEFDVSPPVLMVQVPYGAQPGDQVAFSSTDNKERVVVVPEGFDAGSYFEVSLDEAHDCDFCFESDCDVLVSSEDRGFDVFGPA